MEGRQRIRRRFVQNAGVGRFGDAFINVGKYRQHGLRQIQMGVAFSPANNLAGIHNDIHRVGGVDPHEGGSVFPNNGFPGRMIGDTRHRQTVFSLEGGDGGGTVIAKGTPEEVAESPVSYTGKYIKKMLDK